ncbi:MAG: TonB-dependent receptor [Saprospiraceae bacterium]
MNRIIFIISLLSLAQGAVLAQNGTIRGNIYDQKTGEPIILGNVRLEGANNGTNTDENGFFSLGNVPAKTYKLIASYIGYDSVALTVNLKAGAIVYERIMLTESAIQLGTVNVSGRREQARADVQISKVTVTPKQIRSLPSTGGESDIAQYLPVLPGIIVSGDQGGQLYIRGGSPVQNKILLDGMTIYNPFHTIGFFSVFETETIRSVDVLTGGFNAEYGGRVSAVVDIKTREGNKKRLSGLVSASPFQAKALIEGPIRPFNEKTGSSASFLVTAKHSYLNESSKIFYPYATDTTFFSFASGDTSLADLGDFGLPYQYTDIYGKVSFLGGNGSKLNLFGFNFTDRFNFVGVADLNWTTTGLGSSFTLVPVNSSVVIDGSISFSNYDIALKEPDGGPRSSRISSYSAILNFNYFGDKSQINYGFEFNGFNTDLTFRNIFGATIQQQDFTTEVAGYFKYKYKLGNLIIEPGIRAQYYASQSAMSFEPRVGLKYNITDFLRFKAAGGFYSQNLISTVNELDVVNFFVGFLAGPEETLFEPGTRTPTDTRLQKSTHAVAGVEVDLSKTLELNIEPYYKNFTQLISINRNKRLGSDPDFVTETGNAYGVDFSMRYENKKTYLWLIYSLGYVTRDDGEQVYPTVFDRRHNINALGTYTFGKKNAWEASLRWNMGSGFPFTRTQGFYQDNTFEDLILTNVLTGNFGLGTLLSAERNDGRLSFYHRLDASVKRTFFFGEYAKLEVLASVTNVYNRENVFYVDRVSNNRVNQLPILPSLGMTFSF